MVETPSKKSLEAFYKLKTNYAFTINPCDKYQFFGKELRFKNFRNKMYETFLSFKGLFRLFIEISEPRDELRNGYDGPRLHIHGILQFRKKSELRYLLLFFIRKICKVGRIEIDTIDDIDLWIDYCTKQNLFKNNLLTNCDGVEWIYEV